MALTEARGPASRLRLDPTRCDGAGYCAEIIPERVHLDDWGFPTVAAAPIDDRRLLRLASRAVTQCPRVALSLVGVEDTAGG